MQNLLNNNDTTSLLHLDLKHTWHPCAQMKDYETYPPLMIKSAKGSFIELSSGKKIIDAISSWWCKSLGHNHPLLKQALYEQAEAFEHVIFANTTHHVIATLSEELVSLMPSLSKVFYVGDGSCAIEAAMKMSLHTRQISQNKNRRHFIALKNAYHGETMGALSVSDVGRFKEPYEALLFQPHFIKQIPYVTSRDDPLWEDCSSIWPDIEKSLAPYADSATGLIVEPILQGAGGMKIYSQDFLNRIAIWAKKHDIHLIADEIMTGIGRTGKMLACDHAKIVPDFLCLSKGLTSGWLPFSVVMTSDTIYNHFYDDYETGKAFLHSHTYSGNALAARIALTTLRLVKSEALAERAALLEDELYHAMRDIAAQTKCLTQVRAIGAVVAADLVPLENAPKRLGFKISQAAIEQGALLRPLGNTLYWLPPLNIEINTLRKLKEITLKSIKSIT